MLILTDNKVFGASETALVSQYSADSGCVYLSRSVAKCEVVCRSKTLGGGTQKACSKYGIVVRPPTGTG